MLSKKEENLDPPEVLSILIEIGYTFVTLFAVSESGESITHQFNQFNENLWKCHWYSFPLAMQRIYSIVLVGVQEPVTILGYANTVCNRETFKIVIIFQMTK